jgi:hypothetical protein
MQTYNIQIDEDQRRLLVASLHLQHNTTGSQAAADLIAMLGDLPSIEAESPRVTHGLCL